MSSTDPLSGAERWKAHIANGQKEEEEKEAKKKARKEKEEAEASAKEISLAEAAKGETKTKSTQKARAESSKTKDDGEEKIDPSRIGEPGPIGKKTKRWVKELRVKNEARVEGASQEFLADLGEEGEEKRGKGGKGIEDETTDDEEL